MGNDARVMLNRFLLGRKPEEELTLDEMYEFLHLLTSALENEKRWVKYAAKSRESGQSVKGEVFPETVLAHLMHKVCLASEMIALEKARVGHDGGHVGLDLHTNQIILASVFYGLGVALRGDVALLDRREADLKAEDADFTAMMAPFHNDARHYLQRAHDLSKERDEAVLRQRKPLSAISLNGQFLWAVVVVSFLGKALAEIRHGNTAFANTFHNVWGDIGHLSLLFISFRLKVGPHLPKIAQLMKEYPRWEEK